MSIPWYPPCPGRSGSLPVPSPVPLGDHLFSGETAPERHWTSELEAQRSSKMKQETENKALLWINRMALEERPMSLMFGDFSREKGGLLPHLLPGKLTSQKPHHAL